MINDYRNLGSAKALVGRVYVLTIYTGNQPWEDYKVHSITKNVHEALEWLSQQVQRYGKTVSFVNGCYGYPSPIDYYIKRGEGSGNESSDVIWELMNKIGYQSTESFIKWTKEEAHCDSAIVLAFVDKKGRSYALPYVKGLDEKKYFLEGAVLFTEYNEGGEICSASIAHEICHLFGAVDLYETYLQTKANAMTATMFYPNDIMRHISYNINELRIGEMTAWFMGLTDVEKGWYKQFMIGKDLPTQK